jgi:hypothetical protein
VEISPFNLSGPSFRNVKALAITMDKSIIINKSSERSSQISSHRRPNPSFKFWEDGSGGTPLIKQ